MAGKMLKALMLSCVLAVATQVNAQEMKWDTVFVTKGPLPEGMIFLPAPGMSVLEGSDKLVEIRSRIGSIYNMEPGKVVKIFAVDGILTAMVRTKKNEFYVYSNLATVCPSEGDEIAKGVHLGECMTDTRGWFVLELAKMEKEKFLSKADVMKLLWMRE
ncbi:hypothetical protein JMG10_33475 [Nostoc ellipsosporum NOK]|nr:hypothetical protein [Nostoc ellipsosporum NOK]